MHGRFDSLTKIRRLLTNPQTCDSIRVAARSPSQAKGLVGAALPEVLGHQ